MLFVAQSIPILGVYALVCSEYIQVRHNSKKNNMATFDLFSKRQKKLRGEVPEIYTYESIPNELRVQIVHIIKDSIGMDKENHNSPNEPAKAYQLIHKILCKEYGVFSLLDKYSDENNIFNFLLAEKDVEKVLDVIELCFRFLLKVVNEDYESYKYYTKVELTPY